MHKPAPNGAGLLTKCPACAVKTGIPEPEVQGGRFQWVSGTSVKTFAPAQQSGNQNAISIGSRNVWSNLEHRRDLSWIRVNVPLFVRHNLIDQAMHVIYFAFEVA